MKRVTRAPLPATVRWLGIASLMTDAAGELIYPLLPLFLVSVLGSSVAFVGVIEGLAESTAALVKLISGKLSDRLQRRRPLVLIGYGLTSAVRPLIALAATPWAVLAIRLFDRIGKGLRGSPRDAMVADATPEESHGRAFGYHQAMDNLGAVVGPLIGFGMIAGLHFGLRTVFAWAALPGALAMLAALAVREPQRRSQPSLKLQQQSAPYSKAPLFRYLGVLGVFTLGNASDAFLLLRAAQVFHPGQALGTASLNDPKLLLLWSLHNGVKALFSQPGGTLADRYGRRRLIAVGWFAYAATYLAFAFARSPWEIWSLFAFYGIYYALVEGAEKALVAELVPTPQRGTGFGWYNAVVGLLSLPASVLFGLLFKSFGAATPFEVSAALAGLACILLLWLVPITRVQTG